MKNKKERKVKVFFLFNFLTSEKRKMQQPKLDQECVQHHPKSALEAWSRVTPFDATVGTSKYLDDWRAEKAYMGLAHGKMKPGSIKLDPEAIHPAALREQFTINRFLDLVPDEKTATDASCVFVHDPHLPKKEIEQRNTKCGKWKNCQSVNQKGEFESAESLAKKAYDKEKKGQVVAGFCLNAGSAKKANFENTRAFNEQSQLLRDRVTDLENQLAAATNQNQRLLNACAKK